MHEIKFDANLALQDDGKCLVLDTRDSSVRPGRVLCIDFKHFDEQNPKSVVVASFPALGIRGNANAETLDCYTLGGVSGKYKLINIGARLHESANRDTMHPEET